VVALVHGLAEHVERYDHVARWLVGRGHRVYGYDQRGHGASEGPRTHTPSFDHLLDDLQRFLASVRRETDDRPIVLVGHSMGGLEVATFLATRRPEVAAAVLSGPGLALGPGVGRGRIRLARVLSRSLPRLRLPSGIDTAALSRDPEVQEAYRTDGRIPKSLTVRLASELFGAVARVQSLAPDVRVPLLLLHGEDDPLCPADGSRRFHAALDDSRPWTRVSRVRVYPGLRHEILNEPEREKVLEEMNAWIVERIEEGGTG
jgi:alpha-beta hydrolase superfamily lysophospholipase